MLDSTKTFAFSFHGRWRKRTFSIVLSGDGPLGLPFTWWGCCGLWFVFFNINQPSLLTPFHSVLASVSAFMALSAVFHFMNSPDNSPLSQSVVPVLFLVLFVFFFCFFLFVCLFVYLFFLSSTYISL